MRSLLNVCVLAFTGMSVFAQQQAIPVIEATSNQISIRDGEVFKPNSWTIIPEYNPDVYETENLGEKVTFYTDQDSITVTIEEDTEFDFVVLLNDTDSAYTQIKYREPYLKTLKRAGEYDMNQKREIPAFTYLPSSDENLKRIRKAFKLDSVAGEGNEVSKILSLMYWVHDIVRHDGGSQNPDLKNAIDLIKVCKEQNRAINCRMMATVLNECYLAMGMKSRMVTCMPKPTEFQDCHVINAVYSEQLKKWVWVDPTFAAYVMDEKGILLGIQEVRDRLVLNKPLILNPDANWNHRVSQVKEDYLYNYMAKNLYRLEVPLHSTYNFETTEKNKTYEYVQLLPLEGLQQTPIVKNTKFQNGGGTYKVYKTNNPKSFWEKIN